MLPMWSAASATRVSYLPAFRQRLRANSCQWDTSPRIAPPVVALVVAATVVRRVTWPRSATSLGTCPRSSAATVTNMDTPAASVRSLVTVSLVSPDLKFHMLKMSQILGSSARTVRSMATPRSAAPSLTLTRTAELVPTVAVLILSTSLLPVVMAVVMAVATGTPTPVVLVPMPIGIPMVVVVGKLSALFFDTFDKIDSSCVFFTECCESAFPRSGISGNDG